MLGAVAGGTGTVPVTTAVHTKFWKAAGAREATDAGAGPVSALVLAPLAVVKANADGATLVIVTAVELVTRRVMVAVLPLKRQAGAAGVMALQDNVTELTVRVFELPEREVAVVVPLRTLVVKNTAPLSAASVVQV
jgi:hypothetical protein